MPEDFVKGFQQEALNRNTNFKDQLVAGFRAYEGK